MDKKLLKKIKELKKLAKKSKPTPKEENNEIKETALSRVIKTQEDADLFMKRLRALDN